MHAEDPPLILPQPVTAEDQLTEQDRRQILYRLGELRLLREKLALQEAFIERDAEMDQRERDLAARQLSVEKDARQVAEQQRDMYKEQAKTFEQAYEALRKKPAGFGCVMKRIFSLGIARCS